MVLRSPFEASHHDALHEIALSEEEQYEYGHARHNTGSHKIVVLWNDCPTVFPQRSKKRRPIATTNFLLEFK